MKIKAKRKNTAPDWLLLTIGLIRSNLEEATTWSEFRNVVNSVLDSQTINVRNNRHSGSMIKRVFDEVTRSVEIYTSTGLKVACVIEMEG